MTPTSRIQKAISQYVSVRRELISIGQRYPHLIGGNDNMIGRIGEFYAIETLQTMGQSPIKEANSSRKGFDLRDKITRIRTQVKVISSENKLGRSVRLVEPWDQLVLLVLDSTYKPSKVGILNKPDFNRARRMFPSISKRPFVKITMLGKKGLIGKFGEVRSI